LTEVMTIFNAGLNKLQQRWLVDRLRRRRWALVAEGANSEPPLPTR